MSETAFTPGPWTAERDDVPYDGGFETWVVNADGAGICMMDCPKDEMEANARLIAASPEMYAKLDGLQTMLEETIAHVDLPDVDVLIFKQTIKGIESLLTKARGEATNTEAI